MSAANVEVVRRGYDDFARRDYSRFTEVFAEDAEWHPYLGQVGSGVQRGVAAIEQMLRGTGKESGAQFEARWCQLWSFRGGRVVKVAAYPDREAALEAADAESA